MGVALVLTGTGAAVFSVIWWAVILACLPGALIGLRICALEPSAPRERIRVRWYAAALLTLGLAWAVRRVIRWL